MHLISLKTRAHFCQSPKSAVEGATSGGTKLTAALVHGFGESAYYYWAADQVCHDTNLTAEVIRRVLLRIDDLNKLKGDVPLFIFTAGDASNNKSSHFLTFIVYLVEMKVLDLRWTICSLAWLVQESCTKDEVLGAQTWFLKVNWKYWRKGTFDAKDTSIGVFPDVSSPLPDSFQFASMDTKMSLLIKNQVSALFLRSDNSMSLTSVTWSVGITFLAL